jgi:hypothetical protein
MSKEVKNSGEQVLGVVPEPERNFPRSKMEELCRDAATVVGAMFGVAPEAPDAVQVISAIGRPASFQTIMWLLGTAREAWPCQSSV